MKIEKLKNVISSLRRNGKFNPEGFWSLKRVMKEGKVVPASIIQKGTEYLEEESINELYREEFKEGLQLNVSDEHFKVFEEFATVFPVLYVNLVYGL